MNHDGTMDAFDSAELAETVAVTVPYVHVPFGRGVVLLMTKCSSFVNKA